MNREKYLLMCLSEECHELGKRAIKAARFTLDEVQPGQQMTNRERIIDEFMDVIAVMNMLGLVNSDSGVADRIARKETYMEYSRTLGVVE